MKKLLLSILLVAAASSGLRAQVYLSDTFSYSNGDLTNVSSLKWTSHSGTTPLNVVNGQAFIQQADATTGRQDDNSLLMLSGSPVTFIPDGNANNNDNFLYSSYDVNFSALPSSTLGSYFGHFKTDGASQFYARVGANTAGAAAGTFRLVIANGNWSTTTPPVSFAQDLSLGITYTVVSRFNLDTKISTLWVNPVDETSASVSAADTFTFSGNLDSYALRQGTSTGTPTGAPGDLTVDNLLIGRTFADVLPIPEPSTFALLGIGGLAVLLRRRSHRKQAL
ncbi:MAG: PEP-CTERM sorting domain-containing protein [Verrucomicrobiota bacterium]